jgi:hypothetical protein
MSRTLLAAAGVAALIAACAAARADTPTVATIGVNSGAQPQNVDIQDRTGAWVPVGALNSATHTWTPTVSAAGASGQLQFNNTGAFAGAAGLSWNPATSTLTLPDGAAWSATGLSALKVSAPIQSQVTGPGVALSLNGGVYGQIDVLTNPSNSFCLGWSISSPTVAGTCSLIWSQGSTGSGGGALTSTNGELRINTGPISAPITVFDEYLTGVSTGNVVQIPQNNVPFLFGAAGTVGFCYDSPGEVDVTDSNCGDHNGKLNAALIAASSIVAATSISLPDGGVASSSGIYTGSNGTNGGVVVVAGSPATLPPWSPTTHGAGRIGITSSGTVIGNDGHGSNYYGYPGFVVQGDHASGDEGCTGFCADNDLSLMDDQGNVIAGIQHPVSTAPFPFTLGFQKSVAALTAANEGAPGLVQLFISDVVAEGTADVPYIIWQPGDSQGGGGPAFVGIGPESPNNHNIRVGTSGNEITPWADGSNTIDMDISGCWGVGASNGSATSWSGGQGMAWEGKLCALSAGGVEVMNGSKSGAAGFMAAYFRTTPTTTAGLSAVDPAPADGDRAFVTDAASCSFNGTLTGGGANHCPVHYDGSASAWRAG